MVESNQNPIDKFHTFYDPNNIFDNNSELTEHLVEARSQSNPPKYLDSVSPKGVLFAESLHLDIDNGEQPVSITDKERLYISKQTEGLIDAIHDATLASIHEAVTPKKNVTIMAGMALALYAHHNAFRGNGKPYITHPHAVSKQIEIVHGRHRLFNQDSELEASLFLAMTHDGFEDIIPTDPKATFLNERQFVISPYIARGVFERLGRIDSRATSQTLFLLTKTSGLDGARMKYDRYIERGKSDGKFRTVKLADIHHNDELDPKPSYTSNMEFSQKTYRKQHEYRDAKAAILESLDNEQEYTLSRKIAHHAILAITRQGMDREAPLSDSFSMVDKARTIEIFETHLAQR